MAAAGEIRWPPLGINRWPLTPDDFSSSADMTSLRASAQARDVEVARGPRRVVEQMPRCLGHELGRERDLRRER
jgi:hypothetical protein